MGFFGLVCIFFLELKAVLRGVMPLIHHWDSVLFLLVSLSLNFLFFHLDPAAHAGCPLKFSVHSRLLNVGRGKAGIFATFFSQ